MQITGGYNFTLGGDYADGEAWAVTSAATGILSELNVYAYSTLSGASSRIPVPGGFFYGCG